MGLFSIFLVRAAATGRDGAVMTAHRPLQAVAQIAGFGLGRPKIPDHSMRID
jgi:hypothetical protein